MRVGGLIYVEPPLVASTEEGILTPTRCAFDWKSESQRFCIIAESPDGGSVYIGKVGTPDLEMDSEVILFRFTSKVADEILLFGIVKRPSTSEQFYIMLRLFPESKPSRTREAGKQRSRRPRRS
ncbi:MAG: hypothetical protein FJY85_10415 [Deltaproteobacteria bacterium]|nr:hypothetical protein [Deltaproteobacteria bacterium]